MNIGELDIGEMVPGKGEELRSGLDELDAWSDMGDELGPGRGDAVTFISARWGATDFS